ncbi:MAG: cytochrome b/b6 domain-containing protein [Bryobacterales bacterium]|nr:cytochrome b/b6 domain-containing protein [Bryobacterales bacterium]
MKLQSLQQVTSRGWGFPTLCLALFGLFAPISIAQEKAECNSCHDSAEKVSKSIHASVSCASCHEKRETYPHPENLPKPDCAKCHPTQTAGQRSSVHGREVAKGNEGAPSCATCHGTAHEAARATTPEFRKGVPDTCGMCHSEVTEKYKSSVHGKAIAAGEQASAVCTDCHGEHAILAKNEAESAVNQNHVRETCGRCHGDVRLAQRFGLPTDRLKSFDESFHGMASKSGSQTVANCASCHGFHDILPSTDAKSMTNPKNLPQMCGQCHPGAGSRFAIGTIHWTEGGQEPTPVRYTRLVYLSLIPATLGLMFLHHLGDFARKFAALRGQLAAIPKRDHRVAGELRMLPFERLQHALLAVSFIVLGWTGFALKYPDAWWAVPLVAYETSWPVRGTVHRAAAIIFTICSVLHLVSLIVSKPLREHWKEMIPKARDVREGLAMMAYNLGLRKTKPHVSAHGYIEKVEYWAVVWGALVMGLTGFLLWFNNWSLQFLPKVWLDVATAVHFYEAVLACAAIVVWHFYTVIFDPDVYPMDTAWLTGKTVRKREPEHHGHGGAEQKPASGD